MRVLSLVGPSGSGKTALLKELSKYGCCTMMEGYIGSFPPDFSIHELLSKWMWISRWIERIWEIKIAGINEVFTDRFPIEVVPYAKNGNLLFEPIKHSIIELKARDVHIRTIYLRLPFETSFCRCQKRLKNEPFRRSYGESDIDLALFVFNFYEIGMNTLWDYTIDTTEKSIKELATDVLQLMENWRNNAF